MKEQEPVPEPADIPLDIQGGLALQDVELVMLVGLPGDSLCYFFWCSIVCLEHVLPSSCVGWCIVAVSSLLVPRTLKILNIRSCAACTSSWTACRV